MQSTRSTKAKLYLSHVGSMKKMRKAIYYIIFLFAILAIVHHTAYESSSITSTGRKLRKVIPLVNQYESNQYNEKLSGALIPNNRSDFISVGSHALHRYALSSGYREQQTNAILNLHCFQRWANSVGLKVVEPFASDSKLQFPDEVLYNNHSGKSQILYLHDYIDIQYYNSQARLLGDVPELVPWDKFTKNTGRKLIVLIIIIQRRPSGIYINNEIKASEHIACNEEMSLFYEKHSRIMRALQFQIVRNICISMFKYSNVMSPEDFNSYLDLHNYQGDITLWVSQWCGIGTGRITFTGLREGEFYRLRGGKDHLLTMIRPSERIVSDSKRYVREVLTSDFNQYGAVVVRARPFRNMTVEQNLLFFKDCATQLKQYLSDLNSNSKTFLAISLGRFGDMVVGNYFDHDSYGHYTGNGQKMFQQFLTIVYRDKSITSYDDDFVRATDGITDSGYIGSIQKTIATNARSLVVLGGRSSFQRSIIVNYKANNHSTIKHICYSEFD